MRFLRSVAGYSLLGQKDMEGIRNEPDIITLYNISGARRGQFERPLWGTSESLNVCLPLVTQSHYFLQNDPSEGLYSFTLFLIPVRSFRLPSQPMYTPLFSKFLRNVGKLHGLHPTRLLRKHALLNSHFRHTGYNW